MCGQPRIKLKIKVKKKWRKLGGLSILFVA
jgi:hypothetical protein